MAIQAFTVPTRGIGRRDYSSAIEFASQASIKGHQARVNAVADYLSVPVPTFPEFYATILLFWDAQDNLVIPAPDLPYHFYKISITAGRNALVLCGFYRFASLDDVYVWNVEKWYGRMYDYSKAELVFTNGIKTEEGKVYLVTFAEYSEQATCDIHLEYHSLEEKAIYG